MVLVLSAACATEVSPTSDAEADSMSVDGGGVDSAVLADALPDTAPGDAPNQDASADACVPASCGSLGVRCGDAPSGCGETLFCGDCATGTCVDGTCQVLPVDCTAIAAQPGYEICSSTADECQGVFDDGGGCNAFCAAAALVCTDVFGGEAGCVGPEAGTRFDCDEDTGHVSDWCVCGRGDIPPDPECGNTGATRRQGYRMASFVPRTSWVLDCRDYAYSAQFDEHEACDSLYRAGSGRGTARFDFDVPRGRYEVVVSGRHSANRNRRGVLVHVDAGGTRYSERLDQTDGTEIEPDSHGTYCLEGAVVVTIDSSESGDSDSVSEVALIAR